MYCNKGMYGKKVQMLEICIKKRAEGSDARCPWINFIFTTVSEPKNLRKLFKK